MTKSPVLLMLLSAWLAAAPAGTVFSPVRPSALNREVAVATLRSMLPPGHGVEVKDATGRSGEDGFSVGEVTLLGTNGRPILTAARLTVQRLEKAGVVLRTEWSLAGARYAPEYLDEVMDLLGKALKGSRTNGGDAGGEAAGEGKTGGDLSGMAPLFELLKTEMGKPFQCRAMLTWDPAAKTLTLDPFESRWGEGLSAITGAVLDGAEGPSFDSVLAMVGPTGLLSFAQKAGPTPVMMKASAGKLGVARQWVRMKATHPGADLLALARRLDVKQPMLMGFLGHPAFPTKPALSAEIGVEMVRENGNLAIRPFLLEMKPGLRLSFGLTCDHLDWETIGKLVQGGKVGDLAVKDMALKEMTVTLTDLGALAMAFQMIGDSMKKKPEEVRAMALGKIDELSKPQKNGKGLPAAYVKAIKEFTSGKKPALTFRLKEAMSLEDMDKKKGDFDRTFVIE